MSFTLIQKSSSSSRCCALQTCQRRFSFQDPSQTKHCLFAVVTSHKMPFSAFEMMPSEEHSLSGWYLLSSCLDYHSTTAYARQQLFDASNSTLRAFFWHRHYFFFILPLNIMLSDSFSSVTDHMFCNWKCSPRAFGRN